MAEMFDRMELTGLRKAHMRQLLWYLEDRDHDRRYAGNREQFEQRHHELKEWLKAAVEYAYSEGVVDAWQHSLLTPRSSCATASGKGGYHAAHHHCHRGNPIRYASPVWQHFGGNLKDAAGDSQD